MILTTKKRITMKVLVAESPFFLSDIEALHGFKSKALWNYIHDYKRWKYFSAEGEGSGGRGQPPKKYTIDIELYNKDLKEAKEKDEV